MYKKKQTREGGFTLIEILIVTAFIGVLATTVFVAVDPFTRMGDSRNVNRWKEASNIGMAIYNYTVDNSKLPNGISNEEKQLGTGITGCSQVCMDAEDQCLDLSETLKQYIDKFPKDQYGSSEKTYYSVRSNKQGFVTVKACNAENGMVIEITR